MWATLTTIVGPLVRFEEVFVLYVMLRTDSIVGGGWSWAIKTECLHPRDPPKLRTVLHHVSDSDLTPLITSIDLFETLYRRLPRWSFTLQCSSTPQAYVQGCTRFFEPWQFYLDVTNVASANST